MLFSSKRKQSNTDRFYQPEQIESVLRSCDIKIGGEIDTHFLIYCPYHYNTNTPACEVDKNNGMFICFSCGESGGIIDMVMYSTGRTYFEAVRLINSYQELSNIEDDVDFIIDQENNLPEFDNVLISRLHDDLMRNARGVEYFQSRGITIESMTSLKLGYSKNQDMVTVPVFDHENRPLGFVGRSVEGKSFKNSTGLPKSKVLFNLNNCMRKRVVVVESSFDAIRLWQLGTPAVATLGASISRTQIEILNKYTGGVIVCPDNDAAGSKLEERIVKYCKKEVEVIRLQDVKDVGDLSDIEIIELFKISGNNLNLAI